MESLSFKPLGISEKLKSQENNVSSFKDAEKLVKDGYLRNKNYQGSKELAIKQLNENNRLRDNLESNTLQETREILDKEAMIHEAKTMLYEKLLINENQNQNSTFENFLKGIVDELVIGNYELAIEIYESNGKVIIESLKQLASFEGIKKIAESLGETIWNLFDGDAYEKGKSTAQLGLISTGVGLGTTVGKKGLKLGMKELAKFRVNKESVVSSPDVKGVINETNRKVDGILPKKQLDFGTMLTQDIAKLGNKERLEAGIFYLKRKLTPEQENAIIKAHEVGKDRDGSGIYNYTNEEIKQKAEILKQSGFSLEERRILMEKGVCGKESINSFSNRLKPEQREKLETHGQKLKEQKDFFDRRIELAEFEKLSIPEKLKSLGIPKEFYDLLNNSGVLHQNFDIIERYKKLKYGDTFLKNKVPVNYELMIEKALSKHPNLTKSEAFLVFAYTDNFLFDNLNARLRKTGSESFTVGEKKLINTLNNILLKMPQLEGKFIVRGDSWKGWITPNQNLPKLPNLNIAKLIEKGKIVGYKDGDIIKLHSFTSVSNNLDDIFIGRQHPRKDTLVIINGERGRIRDISDLAMFTNFGENLGKTSTTFEGAMLSDSKVRFKTSEIKEIELKDKTSGKMYKQRVLEVTVDGVD